MLTLKRTFFINKYSSYYITYPKRMRAIIFSITSYPPNNIFLWPSLQELCFSLAFLAWWNSLPASCFRINSDFQIFKLSVNRCHLSFWKVFFHCPFHTIRFPQFLSLSLTVLVSVVLSPWFGWNDLKKNLSSYLLVFLASLCLQVWVLIYSNVRKH